MDKWMDGWICSQLHLIQNTFDVANYLHINFISKRQGGINTIQIASVGNGCIIDFMAKHRTHKVTLYKDKQSLVAAVSCFLLLAHSGTLAVSVFFFC